MIPILLALAIIAFLFCVILVGRPDELKVVRSTTMAGSRLNHTRAAAVHFRKALQLAEIKSEKVFLTKRLQACGVQIHSLRHLEADLKRRDLADVQNQVDAFATLSGRPSQRFRRSEIDSAGTLPPDGILPLNE